MTARSVLLELARLKVARDALVSYNWGSEFIASLRLTIHEYEKDGRPAKGIVLWNAGFANDRLKNFDGLLTVEQLKTSLRNVPPETEVMCAATGYSSTVPCVIHAIKVYEKVCKGQVRKQIVRPEPTTGEAYHRKIAFERVFKVVYNHYEDERRGAFTQELIGYFPTLQKVEDAIRCSLETLDGGDPERRITRSIWNFDVIECLRSR